jgi:sugar diacid utilization regulator
VTLRSGGLGGISAVLTELIRRPVLVDDSRNVVLATAGNQAELPDVQWRAAAVIDRAASSAPVLVSTGTNSESSCFVSTARLGDEVVARIWFPGGDPLDSVGIRAVEHASIVISLELLRIRTAVEVEHRLRGELLADLLRGGPVVSDQVLGRAQRLGHDLTQPHVAMVGALSMADEPAETRVYQRSLSLVAELVSPYRPRPLTAMHRGNIVTLWPVGASRPDGETAEPDQSGLAAASMVQRAMSGVSGTVDATVAVSACGAESYGEAYRTAKGALDIAIRAGRTNTVVRLENLGVVGLLLQLEDSSQLVAFAGRTLGPLIDYDHAHQTDLVATLRTYFACKQDRKTVAGRLHIHPNTVAQRLRRIEQLCEVDLADPAVMLQFNAALTVQDVALIR